MTGYLPDFRNMSELPQLIAAQYLGSRINKVFCGIISGIAHKVIILALIERVCQGPHLL
jgi:hypothetical protein